VKYLRDRAVERSTWAFWIAGLSTVIIAPYPFNIVIGAVLFAAGFLPDPWRD
jgi:RimJ/RimL family protein N-acetyltransferase